MIGQDFSEEFLNVMVASASDDGSDEFDFDADFAIDIYLAFHTQVYRARTERASKTCVLFAVILVNYLSYSDTS